MYFSSNLVNGVFINKYLRILTLTIILVISSASCSTSGNSRNFPNEAAFCPAGAFAAEEVLHVTPLPPNVTSVEDKEFKRWAAEVGAKYPALRKSYELLRECWDHYHTKGEVK